MSHANVYRSLKEDFVSNLTGSSVSEITSVTTILTSSVFLWSVLQSRFGIFTHNSAQTVLLDLLINCGTVLTALTIYSKHSVFLHLAILLPAISIYFFVPALARPRDPNGIPTKRTKVIPKSAAPTKLKAEPVADPLQPKHYLTMYRGAMMAITCTSILAVDFRVFPRRFAKVENWGTSVMDLGVGSFVFAAGVVAARPVLRSALAKVGGSTGMSTVQSIKSNLIHALPLLVLGIIRLLSVKGLDYAEHVTEYGVHWNFFFTLALLGPAVALVDVIIRLRGNPPSLVSPKLVSTSAVAAIVMVGAYEIVLTFTSLRAFIIAAPRINLFSMNREGVFSFVGYLAIFLAGRDAGLAVMPRSTSHNRYRPLSSTLGIRGWWKANVVDTDIGQLVFKAIFWSSLFLLFTRRISFMPTFSLQVSRRLANLPYVLWVAAYNSFQLLLCAAVERACFRRNQLDGLDAGPGRYIASSQLLSAFNANGLAVFLLANLLTGLVNLTVPTLDMGPFTSMSVLAGYITLLAVVALGLFWKGIKLKV